MARRPAKSSSRPAPARRTPAPGIRYTQALTDRAIAKIKDVGIYPDGAGLALHRLPGGTLSWRWRYRLNGKAGIFVLGTYPDMSLAKARAAREDAEEDVEAGRRPILRRREATIAAAEEKRGAEATLGALVEKWFATAAAEQGTWSESHRDKTRGRIDNHIKPTGLWTTPIALVRVADIATLLDRLYAKAPDTANKVRQILSGTFRYAAARGLVESDPVATTRLGSGMRRKRASRKNLPAVTDLAKIAAILRKIEMAQASWKVRGALRLMAFTAARPGRAVAARWSEFRLEGKDPTWTIPRELQKNKADERGDHVIPLAPEVARWLRTLPRDGEFVFPEPTNKRRHVTLEAPSKLLRTSLGLADVHTPHGFRSALSTLANQASHADGSRRFDRDDIEHVLDHEIQSETVRAYDRKRALPRLRVILEWWASTLSQAMETA
ncbi:integrase [Lysobacter niastensis]|uniref:Integrase n=1 Tax=Lysobacter niastensis TaxID=380629 RepID=A0ABU1WAN2_9GAMM|nr:integrase arm-type DNA-binding domain-containing protein [Lysobacter niastensis]MDR7134566.1 integrase [Lysobacter niastensis]